MFQRNELKTILELGKTIQREHEIDIILEAILETAIDITRCDAGTIYLLEENALYFAVMKNRTLSNCNESSTMSLPPVPLDRKHISSLALLDEMTIRIDDAYSRDCTYDLQGLKNYDSRTGYKTKSVLVVPLSGRNGMPVGVFQLINALAPHESGEGDYIVPFTEVDIQMLEYLAPLAALEIQNAKYSEEIDSLKRIILVDSGIEEETKSDSEILNKQLSAGIDNYLKHSVPSSCVRQYLVHHDLDIGLNKYIQSKPFEKKFTDILKSYVFESGMKDSEIAERCQMSRATFSGLLNGKRSMKKKNLIAICISLSLTLRQTTELLELNGDSFRPDLIEDRIVQFYIYYYEEHKMLSHMSVIDLNHYLDEHHAKLLGESIREKKNGESL